VNKFTAANLARAGAPVLGDPEAKVTIVDFSDFQCTNCKRFAMQTEPQIVRDYVDPGLASIVFVHFPVFGPDSVTAASASMCADEQGKFWEFHDHLYANQGAENSGWASVENMKRFASEVDLDRESFDACLDSGKYAERVQADLDLALSRGFSRTPSFIIMKGDGSDAEVLAGAQPYNTFKTLINKKLT
jgi:protein-disulfide isomerase